VTFTNGSTQTKMTSTRNLPAGETPQRGSAISRLPGAHSIRIFAAMLGLISFPPAAPALVADITITDAKIAGGKLVVGGFALAANTQVTLDNKFTTTTTISKSFTFSVIYLPPDCIVQLKKAGSPAPPTRAVVANCARGLNPMGVWSAPVNYVTNDLVASFGSSWRAKRINLNKSPSASPLDWEKFASKGDAGSGATGATGAQGAAGAIGPNGDTGAAGAIGLKGDAGTVGAAGSPGLAGAIGPKGNAGAIGAAGSQGLAGAIGPIGTAGATGAAGSAGLAGAIGPQGNAGATGTAGSQGLVGAIGPVGTAGATGAAGSQGLVGAIGPIGTAGATGAAGSQGLAGAIGQVGTAGASGATGSQGPAGAIGAQGAQGATGAQGQQGPTGAQGVQGTVLASAEFYALMPSSNAATIAAGAAVSFPTGVVSGSDISQLTPSTFNLSTPGLYLVMFQVSVTEAGQLVLAANGTELPSSVAGRATGASQIVGMSFVTVAANDTVLQVRNPTGNTTLTITPSAGGTHPVSAHVTILRLS
jgi:hypothetical protein